MFSMHSIYSRNVSRSHTCPTIITAALEGAEAKPQVRLQGIALDAVDMQAANGQVEAASAARTEVPRTRTCALFRQLVAGAYATENIVVVLRCGCGRCSTAAVGAPALHCHPCPPRHGPHQHHTPVRHFSINQVFACVARQLAMVFPNCGAYLSLRLQVAQVSGSLICHCATGTLRCANIVI